MSNTFYNVVLLATRFISFLKNEQIYHNWTDNQNVLYTYSEMMKFHRSFSNPSTDKVYDLLKVARSWETD